MESDWTRERIRGVLTPGGGNRRDVDQLRDSGLPILVLPCQRWTLQVGAEVNALDVLQF